MSDTGRKAVGATPPADLSIANVRLFSKGRLLEGCISISDGKIIYVGREAGAPKAERVIRGRGLLALPGPIDVHVHLRDEELSYKEDFYTGTCSAVAGGITSVLDMPNTSPPVNSPSRLRERMAKARDSIVANVGFYSLFPSSLDEIGAIAEAGAVGFKAYLHEPKTALPIWDGEVLRRAVGLANEAGLPVAFHAEDGSVIEEAERGLGRSVGAVERFVLSRPPEAELRAVERLARALRGLRVHICHVSVPEAVKLAKSAGFSVEATPHHLFLDASAYERFGPLALMDPPLRRGGLVSGLRDLLYSGLIDVVASDHAPHAFEEKLDPSSAPPGIPGLETLLPLLLNEVAERRLSLARLVELLCLRPAEIFGLDAGLLEPGRPADIVLVDLKTRIEVEPERFLSKAKYSPFKGLRLRGAPSYTIVNGVLAFERGEIVAERGCGRILKSKLHDRERREEEGDGG